MHKLTEVQQYDFTTVPVEKLYVDEQENLSHKFTDEKQRYLHGKIQTKENECKKKAESLQRVKYNILEFINLPHHHQQISKTIY